MPDSSSTSSPVNRLRVLNTSSAAVAVRRPRRTELREPPPSGSSWRLDLLQVVPGLKWLVTRRWFQFAVVVPNLLFFYFFLIAGTIGSPVGNRNIIIVFVWIFWWFLLISLMVPFASRIWCMVCPFPFFGEWFQRRALIGARVGKPGVGRNRMWGLNLRWPRWLSNIWLQNIGFLAMCTFSVALVTRPIVSVGMLGGLVVLATLLHMIYRQRAFCSYVCPVSGFLSLYAMTSMVEVRAKDTDTCAKCTDKGCLAGNERGWGCAWLMYPSKMVRNNYCGLCMECIKTCPHDNMTVQLRPFCSDTKLKGYDEAWKAFIMLTLAVAYSINLLGPWGQLKDFANVTEVGNWRGFALYAGALWAAALVVVPGLFFAAVWAGRKLARAVEIPMKTLFLGLSYTLVPFGLLAWIAFSLPLIMVNGSYIVSVISDPLGRGWDLFGTAHLPWTPVLPHWVPYIQMAFLLFGFAVSLWKGLGIAEEVLKSSRKAALATAPVALFLLLATLGFMKLYAG